MRSAEYQAFLDGAKDRVARTQAQRDDVMNLVADRDPCARCGVRKDRHKIHGCKRWAA